jgi:hypothetical protein
MWGLWKIDIIRRFAIGVQQDHLSGVNAVVPATAGRPTAHYQEAGRRWTERLPSPVFFKAGRNGMR